MLKRQAEPAPAVTSSSSEVGCSRVIGEKEQHARGPPRFDQRHRHMVYLDGLHLHPRRGLFVCVGKTDLLRKNTKKIYKAEIEKQTCRGAAGNELETHLSRWGDWDSTEDNITVKRKQ